MKQRISVSEPSFGGLRGNACESSLGGWKACSRLPIGFNCTFIVSAYGWGTNTSKSAFVEMAGSLWGQILGWSVTFMVNTYISLDRGMVLVQLCRWKFSHKKLCSRLCSMNFIYRKTNSLFEPLFGDVRGNICTSSIARWKARGQLPILNNWSVFGNCYGSGVISRYWSK